MPAASDRKVVLVTRKTRLEDLIAKYLTAAQARFYVEHLGADFSDYQREHEVYREQQHKTVQSLEQWGRYQIIERSFLPNFIFGPSDIVVALGQPGRQYDEISRRPSADRPQPRRPTPDARRHDGILLPFSPDHLPPLLQEVAADKRAFKAITMAKASLANGQVLYAVNDLFIGPRSHTSAVYEIAAGEQRETQSSSGLIISTGLGSTAWFKSIVTGSLAIAGAFGQPATAPYLPQAWDSDELRFAVREPFPSKTTQVSLVYGRLTRPEKLSVRSLCRRTALSSVTASNLIVSISIREPRCKSRLPIEQAG